MNSKKYPVFFGCDFDPNPDINSIRRKLIRYIESAGQNHLTPYDILTENINNGHGDKQTFRLAGKYQCPNWVSANPDFNQELYPEMYREFIDAGGCLEYSIGFGRYVASGFEEGEIPVTIGVDHCLSGGIVQGLSKRYKDLQVVTFDAHLDAFLPRTRNGLVGYMRDHSTDDIQLPYEHYEDTFIGNYDTGSFLYYLMKGGALPGKDLMVLGIQDDPPSHLWEIKDRRVTQYLDEYQWLKSQGMVIRPLGSLSNRSISTLPDLKGKLEGRNVYISIDLDVFSGRIGEVTRYSNDKGLTLPMVLKTLEWLGLKSSNIVGMDIMELDVNSLPIVGVQESEAHHFLKELINGLCREAGIITI